MMSHLIACVAALLGTLFTGAAIYITLVEHPARLSCGTEAAARHRSIRRSAFEQKRVRGTAGALAAHRRRLVHHLAQLRHRVTRTIVRAQWVSP
jgi:hypothetical protein